MNDIDKLRNKYISLYNDVDGVSIDDLDKIEQNLQVKLPKDFREISRFYSGGDIGGKSIHSFAFSDSTNLLGETLRLREAVGLPNRIVVIAEQDMSVIVMDTENKPSIIWIDSVEVTKLHKQDFISNPDVWEGFSDFFNYLLEEEEEERKY